MKIIKIFLKKKSKNDDMVVRDTESFLKMEKRRWSTEKTIRKCLEPFHKLTHKIINCLHFDLLWLESEDRCCQISKDWR